jgi:hypothetical protein
MKIGTEIVIGIVIGVVMTIGLVVGGWFGLIFLLDRGYKKHAQKVEQAEVDGREFGKTTDQNGCMEKGFLRDAAGESFYMGVAFVEECLKSSKPTPDFCDGVPYGADLKWEVEECKKVGHNRESCFHAFVAKGSFCDGKKREQARVDGREFGKTTDQNGCMEKGFLRDAAVGSGFVKECLKSSKPIPDFCDGVPLGYDPGKEKDISKWLDERCKKVGHNGRSCLDTFIVKRDFCTESNGNESK